MACKRTELISATEDGDLQRFSDFMSSQVNQKVKKKDNTLALKEVLSSCSKDQLEGIWCGVQTACCTHMLAMGDVSEECQVQKDTNTLMKVLEYIVVLAKATIHSQNPIFVPSSLENCMTVLHGLLPDLPSSLQNDLSLLFEEWWKQSLSGREHLVTNTVLFLLRRACKRKIATDVKRIWALHEALTDIDWLNASCQELRELMIQSFICPSFLNTPEGCRFLGFAMSLHSELALRLHVTVKNNILSIPQNLMPKLGEVYFKAWQKSEDQVLKTIENHCIQDMMYHAIHAQKCVFGHLRLLLGYIHDQRVQHGVDKLLSDLYGPILWRSLKVANPEVRANATAIFFSAFPVMDTSASQQEKTTVLQSQFDMFQVLLHDPYPLVRTRTVVGVMSAIAKFREIIPVPAIKSLLKLIMSDLLHDSKAVNVRLSVIKGIELLMDNALCIPLVKPLLPLLKNHIHDNAEVIRIALLDLLIKIKKIRTVKFWEIIPLEHLLHRLATDTDPVQRRIVQILLKSYLPLQSDSSTKINMVTTLIQENPKAARNFFANSSMYISSQDTAEYIELLLGYVLHCVCKETDSNNEDENLEEVPDDLVIGGLLEVIICLFSGIDFQKAKNKELEPMLQEKLSLALPEIMQQSSNESVKKITLRLACFLPHAALPGFLSHCLNHLKKANKSNHDYECYVECVCFWGKMGDILHIIGNWLQGSSSSQKQLLASGYLSFIMRHSTFSSLLLSDHKQFLLNLVENVSDMKDEADNCLRKNETETTEAFLSKFSLFCRILVFAYDQEKSYSTLRALIDLVEEICLPVIEQSCPEKGHLKMAKETSQKVLECGWNLLGVVKLSENQFKNLFDFCMKCLNHDKQGQLLATVMTCIKAIIEYVIFLGTTEDRNLTTALPYLLDTYFVHLTILTEQNNLKEKTQPIASSLSDIFIISYKSPIINDNLLQNAFRSLIKCALKEDLDAVSNNMVDCLLLMTKNRKYIRDSVDGIAQSFVSDKNNENISEKKLSLLLEKLQTGRDGIKVSEGNSSATEMDQAEDGTT